MSPFSFFFSARNTKCFKKVCWRKKILMAKSCRERTKNNWRKKMCKQASKHFFPVVILSLESFVGEGRSMHSEKKTVFGVNLWLYLFSVLAYYRLFLRFQNGFGFWFITACFYICEKQKKMRFSEMNRND